MISVEDFWKYVSVDGQDECWEWLGAVSSNGYGSLNWHGYSEKAHRIAYQIYNDVKLPRMKPSKDCVVVMHSCDNRKCCNPRHLEIGTYRLNRIDCVEKHRHNAPVGDANGSRRFPDRLKRGDENVSRAHPELLKRGSNHPNATLTEEQVKDIRAKVAAGQRRCDIAQLYGITGALVWKIVERRIWRHV